MNKGTGFGLKGKLTVIIAVAVILSVAVVGSISIFSMKAEMEREVQNSQMLLAEGFCAITEQFFEDAKGMIRTASKLPAVQDVSSIPEIRDDIKGVPQDVDLHKREVMDYIIHNYGDFQYME